MYLKFDISERRRRRRRHHHHHHHHHRRRRRRRHYHVDAFVTENCVQDTKDCLYN